jgi:DNA-binding CsgD family transcriptional regulator
MQRHGAELDWIMLRPFELAGTSRELPVAVVCAVCLIAIFLADVLTPVDVLLTTLAIFPLLFAVWTLGRWSALAVALLAAALFIDEAITGSANDVTIGVELVAYGTLAGLARIYGHWLAASAAAPLGSASTGPSDRLTRREREVVALAAHGRTAAEIADLLHIGERTVETHLAHAYPKLGVRSKLELVKVALRTEFRTDTDDVAAQSR